jgi:hypothetical protein
LDYRAFELRKDTYLKHPCATINLASGLSTLVYLTRFNLTLAMPPKAAASESDRP